MKVWRWILTGVCFFGSGATDLDTLVTSLWTSVKIWLRFSTFSFFMALICEAREKFYRTTRSTARQTGSRGCEWSEILRVSVLLWQVWLCSWASSSYSPLERRSCVFSPFVYSLPCYLQRPTGGERLIFFLVCHSFSITLFFSSFSCFQLESDSSIQVDCAPRRKHK